MHSSSTPESVPQAISQNSRCDGSTRHSRSTFGLHCNSLQNSLPLLRAGAAADPARGAKIVALASITGVYAERGLAVYGATKAALISLVQTLNAEESANGISATSIAPAFVDTDMSAWTHDAIPPSEMLEVNDIVEMTDAILRLSARAVVGNIVMTRAGTDGYRA